jgi:predicted nucleic acid-binding protein
MTIGDVKRIFLDTNILVYANAERAPLHQVALQSIQALSAEGSELWISRQILREYLAILSRPQTFSHPLPANELTADVRYFQDRFRIAEDDATVTAHLLALVQRFPTGGKQVHDANIVATMLAYGIPSLLTNNTDDFVRFSGMITILPLQPKTQQFFSSFL